MSWQKVDIDGQMMWQRSDGSILPSLDAVQAFEDYEQRLWEKQKARFSGHIPQDDPFQEEELPNEPISNLEIVVMGILLLISVGMMIFGLR
jgi:monoamine oxidase